MCCCCPKPSCSLLPFTDPTPSLTFYVNLQNIHLYLPFFCLFLLPLELFCPVTINPFLFSSCTSPFLSSLLYSLALLCLFLPVLSEHPTRFSYITDHCINRFEMALGSISSLIQKVHFHPPLSHNKKGSSANWS